MRYLVWALFGIASSFASELLDKMSVEEKVGQVLMVHFHGEDANADAKMLIEEVKVGAFIYYTWANGLTSPQQIQKLSSSLQQLAQNTRLAIPLLIAADQEGGIVARLREGFTIFPGNRALGETGDPTLAEKAAFAMGEEMLAVGVNMNLAPVVDVSSNPRNPAIGIRSYADTPEKVIQYGGKALVGYQRSGVITTLKHYPGYGDVSVDPHADLPEIRKSTKELQRIELLPFIKLAPLADAVMTAHILVPAVDPNNCATLSSKILAKLRASFEGVIVADSLVMEGVLKQCHSVDEAAIRALDAGCDLLILGGRLLEGKYENRELTPVDVVRIHRAIVEAVLEGRISEEKLNASVERILTLKERRLKSEAQPTEELDKKVGTRAHRDLAEEIAMKAIKLSGKVPDFKGRNVLVVAPDILKETLQASSLLHIGKSTQSCFFSTPTPEMEVVKKAAQTAERIVIFSHNAWKDPSAVALTQMLCTIGKPVVVVCVRDPLDAALFPKAALLIKSFSPTLPSLQVLSQTIESK